MRRLRHIAGLCLALSAGAAFASLPACGSGQLPYSAAGWWGTYDTPEMACVSAAFLTGGTNPRYLGGGSCYFDSSSPSSPQVIEKSCEPATPHWSVADTWTLTDGRIEDYMVVFWAFFLILVTLWGLRTLYGIFNGDHDKS